MPVAEMKKMKLSHEILRRLLTAWGKRKKKSQVNRESLGRRQWFG